MGRSACTEPQCLYKGDLYLLYKHAYVFYIIKGFFKSILSNAVYHYLCIMVYYCVNIGVCS